MNIFAEVMVWALGIFIVFGSAVLIGNYAIELVKGGWR